MDPVTVDWLSILLGVIGFAFVGVGLFNARLARLREQPPPEWVKALRVAGSACVVIVALVRMTTDM